jgi:wyosine [tRNA(Phe)-imidazoG37] synthetase (radical SAM superfamily)
VRITASTPRQAGHSPPPAQKMSPGGTPGPKPDDPARGCPRFYFAGSNCVYAVISSRARGLAVGVNLNPNQYCNFDCAYCEVDRFGSPHGNAPVPVNAQAVAHDLAAALSMIQAGALLKHPYFASLPPEVLRLVHVPISGDGEPTLCPNFLDVMEAIVHLRAAGLASYFKLVLLTNGSALDRPNVQAGLRLLTRADEVWVKLDAGSQAGMDRINRSPVPIERVCQNILDLGRRRPVVIQSLFVEIDGQMPDRAELAHYARRLNVLKEGGAQIPLVQIYSASRGRQPRRCRHLSLRVLSDIASLIRQITGLRVEVF